MKFYSIILFVCAFSSCNILPKGISYIGTEKFFFKSYKNYPVLQREAQGREPGWELGFAFTPHKEGRISGIWIKNPTKATLPVTIWDADTKQVIQTFQFTIADSINNNHFVLTEPIMLVAQKKYCITINVTKYYYYNLPFETLPLQLNSCTLNNSVYEETYYQRYPQFEINNVVHGLIDVDLDWKQ
ncbi:MAG: DUF4082 domain-containing protein [Ferruginibacter sp.]|nr:DUF4082 domain-containing protein [Ferruginibacter sp.]